jgi:serine/threonine-protein kinase
VNKVAALPSDSSSPTLVVPRARRGTTRPSTVGLPPDVVSQSAARLRILALLYAFVFFMAGVVPPLLLPGDRAHFLSSFGMWGPAMIGIAVALAVALVAGSPRVSLEAAMKIGLVFEVVGSYGIAAAEFLENTILDPATGFFGLSWVAVWTVLFTVVIPTRPRRAVMAALASVSSVPAVIAFVIATNPVAFRPGPLQFFFGLVFPYLLVVVMAYVGARVVYALGTEVTRARELGSYQLVERLGKGGMGEVWRASHRLLARPAAIKLIRSSIDADAQGVVSEDARRRFEREAQVIATLRSPHTVNLFDFGMADDGTFYYVMELLDGLDTDALVRQTGPMPAERVVHVLRQVCHSLSEAESHGLVHRDIKPANIFLCRYGEDFDFVKVLDFGIVKATEDSAATEAALTVENVVRGTPSLHCPGTGPGRIRHRRTRGYLRDGLCGLLAVDRELVFAAETTIGLLMHHANTVAVPPSSRTELPIPEALDRIVMACLAKNPAERPQTARELSSRLAAIDIGNAWTEVRARNWWQCISRRQNLGTRD